MVALDAIAIAVLCALIVAPALTLFHELGHAVIPLAMGKGPVWIRLGTQPVERGIRWGRLRITVAPFSVVHGWCSWQAELRPAVKAMAYGMGPAFSLVALSALAFAAMNTVAFPHHLLLASCYLAALQFASTAFPMRYPAWYGPYAGRKSDGLLVVESLRRTR